MKNGRCRLRGGKSPGAPRGVRNGNYRHGLRTMAAMAQRRHAAEIRRARRELICLSLELSVSQQSTGESRGDEYHKKARELKERQTEITLRIEQHQKGKTDYCTTLETLISVASRAAEPCERAAGWPRREGPYNNPGKK